MFRALLGEHFESLPATVREVHGGEREIHLHGGCDIARGVSPLSRLMAAATSLPQPGKDVPTVVRILRDDRGETWEREFAGRRMRSVLRARGGFLEERLGPTTFTFALDVAQGVLLWRLVGVRALGIPLPVAWFRGVEARESEEGGRYRFEVRAALPLAGLLVHYRGHLQRR